MFYRCLTKEGDIDWDRMKTTLLEFSRSEEERRQAVTEIKIDSDLPRPRIWIPLYGEIVTILVCSILIFFLN